MNDAEFFIRSGHYGVCAWRDSWNFDADKKIFQKINIIFIWKGEQTMDFILEQAKNTGMAAILIILALTGTVGILKLIRRFSPGNEFPKDPVSKKLEEEGKKLTKQTDNV